MYEQKYQEWLSFKGLDTELLEELKKMNEIEKEEAIKEISEWTR
jgi:hypothetical protein